MGDIKKLKKKYSTPAHPWNKNDIEKNKVLKSDYGLKSRKDILLIDSFLRKYKNIAKKLIAGQTVQGEKEKKQMMDKLQKLGLVLAGSGLDDVLSLQLKDVLERRLQSLVFRKGLARSMNQARQFITHRHIFVGKSEITSPAYLVSVEEENLISFKQKSALADEEHPERINFKAEIKEEAEKIKKVPRKKSKPEEGDSLNDSNVSDLSADELDIQINQDEKN